jgi:hypothetical protein
VIEEQLLNPPELLELIRDFENNEFCVDCQTVGHLNWDTMLKDAMKQMYICPDCSDAVALVEFAHDMVRVLKQGLEPRYPNNFQHWIDQLTPLQTLQGLYDKYQMNDVKFNDEIMKKIMYIKNKRIEMSFCGSRPHDVRRGGKSNVEVPEPCKNNVIIHNHPSGSNAMSDHDRVVACENKSVLCTVTPERTVCYAPCSDRIVKEIPHGQT